MTNIKKKKVYMTKNKKLLLELVKQEQDKKDKENKDGSN
jgi:hypothetical protein